jgi:hypothetical protein
LNIEYQRPTPHIGCPLTLRPLTLMSIAAFDSLIAEMKLSAEDGSSELKLQLIALKKQRNALTPFAGAPNEVIVRIFANLTHKLQSPDSFF